MLSDADAGRRPRPRARTPARPSSSSAQNDGEVVRRSTNAADRDQDQVVEQDRPAGDEAPELVEGVAGEGRRAAALLVQRRALDVGGHRHGEEDSPRARKTTGVSPSAAVGHHAEREVDRGADRAAADREQRGRAEAALDQHARVASSAARRPTRARSERRLARRSAPPGRVVTGAAHRGRRRRRRARSPATRVRRRAARASCPAPRRAPAPPPRARADTTIATPITHEQRAEDSRRGAEAPLASWPSGRSR